VSVYNPPSTILSLSVSVQSLVEIFAFPQAHALIQRKPAPIFPKNILQHTPKHLAKGSNLFPFASQPEYWCAYVCVRACVIRPCHHPILPAHQIVPIPESKVSWYPLSFPSILQSFPPQSPSNFHVLSNSSPCPPFQFSCSFHIHIISLMLILLLLPPGIPAPLPFPLECECELPGAGLTDPLGCMGVGARWPGFCC
jgi:hypothetical protein